MGGYETNRIDGWEDGRPGRWRMRGLEAGRFGDLVREAGKMEGWVVGRIKC